MHRKKFFKDRDRAVLYRKRELDATKLRELACTYLVMSNTALAYNLPAESMMYKGRGRKNISMARHIAQYLCHVGFGMNLTLVGKIFKRDRTSIAHACQQVEDLRDSKSKDLALDCLEIGLQEFANSLQLVSS